MKGQSTGLWLLAIGLIALFMIATMAAPALNDRGTGNPDNSMGGSSDALTFNMPAMELRDSGLEVGDSTELAVRTAPAAENTGDGGAFAWVLAAEGVNGDASTLRARYGEEPVQWYDDGEDLISLGPRFSLGPGGAPVDVSASFVLTPTAAGRFVLKTWIATAGNLISLDPSGLDACSEAGSVGIQVVEAVEEGVTVVQELSGPDAAIEDEYVRFTLTSTGRATGGWDGTVSDRITFVKEGIRASDLTARTIGDRTRSITWADQGDRLVATLQTTSPFDGTGEEEVAEWSVTVEVRFNTDGDYIIECSSIDSGGTAISLTTVTHPVTVTHEAAVPEIGDEADESILSAPNLNGTPEVNVSDTSSTRRE